MIFPVADTLEPVITPPTVLAAVTVPVALKLEPVAAPMLGVVNCALALTEILPRPSNSVVVLSTLAENTVPTKLKPAAVLALYIWLLLNSANCILLVPKVITPDGASTIQADPAFTLPPLTKK